MDIKVNMLDKERNLTENISEATEAMITFYQDGDFQGELFIDKPTKESLNEDKLMETYNSLKNEIETRSNSKSDLTIKFLGTCGDRYLPISDPPACIQCREEVENSKHRNQSSILINKKIMIDAGNSWIGKINKINPKYILLTHAHPDHAGAIVQDVRKISAEVHGPEGIREDIVELYGAVGIHIVEHPIEKSFRLGGVEFSFIPVYHSTRAPTCAVKVDGRLMYAPDFAGFKKTNQLNGIEMFIGDGSTLEKGIIRKNKTGHMSMLDQLELCNKVGIKHIRFTHVGHLYTSSVLSKRILKSYTRDKTELEIQKNYIMNDGDGFRLTKDSEVLSIVGSFIESNKPAWKAKSVDEVEKVPAFSYPSLIIKRIDGMPVQVHFDGEEVKLFMKRSGRELFVEESVDLIREILPDETVLDGVLVVDEDSTNKPTIWITDALFWNGEDLRDKSLFEREKYIAKIEFGKYNIFAAPEVFILKDRDHLDSLFRNHLQSTDLVIRMAKSKISKTVHNKGWIGIKTDGEVMSTSGGIINLQSNRSEEILKVLDIDTKEECENNDGIWTNYKGKMQCFRSVDSGGDREKISDSE